MKTEDERATEASLNPGLALLEENKAGIADTTLVASGGEPLAN
jgi:hypothetical protein